MKPLHISGAYMELPPCALDWRLPQRTMAAPERAARLFPGLFGFGKLAVSEKSNSQPEEGYAWRPDRARTFLVIRLEGIRIQHPDGLVTILLLVVDSFLGKLQHGLI